MKTNNNEHKFDNLIENHKCKVAPHAEMARNYDADDPCETE